VVNAAIASGLDGGSEGSLVVENIEISERDLGQMPRPMRREVHPKAL